MTLYLNICINYLLEVRVKSISKYIFIFMINMLKFMCIKSHKNRYFNKNDV